MDICINNTSNNNAWQIHMAACDYALNHRTKPLELWKIYLYKTYSDRKLMSYIIFKFFIERINEQIFFDFMIFFFLMYTKQFIVVFFCVILLIIAIHDKCLWQYLITHFIDDLKLLNYEDFLFVKHAQIKIEFHTILSNFHTKIQKILYSKYPF